MTIGENAVVVSLIKLFKKKQPFDFHRNESHYLRLTANESQAWVKKANILLIMTDQLRADHVGFGGNKIVRTPILDRLASRSLVTREGRSTIYSSGEKEVYDYQQDPNEYHNLASMEPAGEFVSSMNDRLMQAMLDYSDLAMKNP